MEFDRVELIDLYKSAADEMRNVGNTHQARIQSFMTLLSALFVATVAGLINAEQLHDYLLVSLGPILIAGVAEIGLHGVNAYYKSFLETVSVRAKYEQLLGLTKPIKVKDGEVEEEYWKNEPIIAHRNLKSRKEEPSTEKWIAKKMISGPDQRWIRILFRGAQLLAIIMLAISLFLAESNYSCAQVKEPTKIAVEIKAPNEAN